ncbi:MAG: CHAT domain-containing protein [Nitrospirae bacterium]|nr:CHAT domain-containing protein [Nitrospirota bacterium]
MKDGRFEQAIKAGTEASRLYGEKGNKKMQADALIQTSRAYQFMGKHIRAIENLKHALMLAQHAEDDALTASIQLLMADSHISLERTAAAEGFLKEAFSSVRKGTDSTSLIPFLFNSQGNLYFARKMPGDAADSYRTAISAAEKTGLHLMSVKSAVNLAKVLYLQNKREEASGMLEASMENIRRLPDSYEKGFMLIEIAMLYHRLPPEMPAPDREKTEEIVQNLLMDARSLAGKMQNNRLASFAFGYLGKINEEMGRYEKAIDFTRQAIFHAQEANSRENIYLWQWQEGRLFRKLGRPDEALDLYRSAFRSLQSMRSEIAPECLTLNQLSYGEVIEPLYTGLMDLILRRAAGQTDKSKTEALLLEAIDIIEALNVAELQDFFQDACLASRRPIKKVTGISDKKTAVIYPIALSERLELLVSLPGEIKQVSVPISSVALASEARQLRRYLEDRTKKAYLTHARKLHDWIVRPIEDDLLSKGIETTIFIPSGSLRSIPFSALYDGKQFLIRKFAVAVAQGYSLIDDHRFEKQSATVLSAGITESVSGYAALENVSTELETIHELFKGMRLKNKDFIQSRLETELEAGRYSIVHLATHGEFGDTPENTFLLTWDGRLTMDSIEKIMMPNRIRKNPIELLVFSACQTAKGNDRAALGLAGISVKAGVKSALATLWSVDDEATYQLITEFYRQMKDPSTSKAKALQQAQLKVLYELNYRHPFYWSPFLLIGNWL